MEKVVDRPEYWQIFRSFEILANLTRHNTVDAGLTYTTSDVLEADNSIQNRIRGW